MEPMIHVVEVCINHPVLYFARGNSIAKEETEQ